MVTRMVGGAEGGTSGSAAGVAEEERGTAIGDSVAGAIAAAATEEAGATGAGEMPAPDAGELSRMRSVTRSMRSVLTEGGGREKVSRAAIAGGVEKDGACASGATGAGFATGKTGEAESSAGTAGIADGGAAGRGFATGGDGATGEEISERGKATCDAALATAREDAAATGAAAAVSMRSSVNRTGAAADSKREGMRGWMVAAGASVRWRSWRMKLFMRPRVRGKGGGGPG